MLSHAINIASTPWSRVPSFQMPPSLPLTEEDRTLFVNRKLADNMTTFFVTVAMWGSQKDDTQTFEDYLKSERSFTDEKIKKTFKSPDDLSKIRQTSFNKFDVTFMYKLLPLMCDGIDQTNIKDPNGLECHLKEMKDFRNSIMHEAHGAALDKDLVDKVETTALKLLDIAGTKYGKGTDEISKAQDEARKLISNIKKTAFTEEGKVHFYQQKVVDEGLPELRTKIEDYKGFISPYFEHAKSFCSLQLTYKEKGAEKTISCEDIFNHATDKGVRLLIIEGQSGAGKSHLMQELRADILREKGKKTFKGSDEFDTPLLFQCRKRTCETIAKFASEEFPCLGATSTEEGLTEKVLSKMKSLLLVDGVDEANEVSKKMLDNIIAFLKNNRDLFCIFTSRPFSAEEFKEKLELEGLSNFQALALKKLNSVEEQITFLTTACEKGKDISSVYRWTGLKLDSPVLLAIYGYLWLKEPESLTSCKRKEQIMRAWINCGLKVAKQRLEQRNVMDCKGASHKILKSISFISFYCLVRNKLDIGNHETEWLKDEIKSKCACVNIDSSGKGIPVNIEPREILSCFVETSSNNTMDDILGFPHKSLQEIFASIYVAEKMHKSRKYFREIFFEALDNVRPSQSPMPSATNFDFRRFFKKFPMPSARKYDFPTFFEKWVSLLLKYNLWANLLIFTL